MKSVLFKLQYIYFKFLSKLRGVAVKNSHMGIDSKLEPGTIFVNSSIDNHSYCGYYCTIINASIGRFCSISNRVVIGGVAHPMHFVSTSPVFLSHKDSVKEKFSNHHFLPEIKTLIGHDVWIGEGVLIKAGVKIGNGAVIGMGSVVTKDVPDYAIVAGNPAKIIRYRFEQELIDALIASEWWSLPAYKLKKLGRYTNDPKVFIEKLKGG